MAYEVTKHIKGHDYLYVVEAYRDPETNRRKTRWQYAGAVDNGELRQSTPRRTRNRVTRDDIVEATAHLLPFRDPEYITVDVIAASAGSSRSAFYRHFHNQQEAMHAAIVRMAEEHFRDLPAFDHKPRDTQEAKAMLRRWCEALDCPPRLLSMLQRALRQRHDKKVRLRIKPLKTREAAALPLSLFLQQLTDEGLATIANPLVLARTIHGMLLAQRVAVLLTPPEHELPLPAHEEVYQLIERAVFGAEV